MKNSSSEISSALSTVMRSDDWKSLGSSINHLFKDRTLQHLDLDVLMEKVRSVVALGLTGPSFISLYKDSILKAAMIVLRSELKEKEKKTGTFFEVLAEIWTDFYRCILPYLIAIFSPIETTGNINFSWVNLIGFRDFVLFKSKINEVLQPGQTVSKQIKQMLVIITSVPDKDRNGLPTANFLRMEELTSRVVRPLLGVKGLYKVNDRKDKQTDATNVKERKASRTQLLRVEIKKLNCTSSGSMSPDEKELNNNKDENLVNKLRNENSPRNNSNPHSAKSPNELNEDDDMLEYWEMRQQRWKSKEESLDIESLN